MHYQLKSLFQMGLFGFVSLALAFSASAQTTVDSTLVWNGNLRYYRLYVPAAVAPIPGIIIFLHGAISDFGVTCTSTSGVTTCTDSSSKCSKSGFPYPCGPALQDGTSLQQTADYLGMVAVWADSTFCQAGTNKQWLWDINSTNFFNACGHPPDDPGFLRQLITNVQATLSGTYGITVPAGRVVIAGFSTGAFETYKAAASLADIAKGYVAMEGAECADTTSAPCAPIAALATPVSFYVFHARNDSFVAYGGCTTGCEIAWGSLGTFTLPTKDSDFNYLNSSFNCNTINTFNTITTAVALTSISSAGLVTCYAACTVAVGDQVTFDGTSSSATNSGSTYPVASVINSTQFTVGGLSVASTGGTEVDANALMQGLSPSLSKITGTGAVATATCATNCGYLVAGQGYYITSSSYAGYNKPGYIVSVSGSPVTSFTFYSSKTANATGGKVSVPDKVASGCTGGVLLQFQSVDAGHVMPSANVQEEAISSVFSQIAPGTKE